MSGADEGRPGGAAERIAGALRAGELEVTRLAEGSGVVLHVPTLRSCTLNPAGMLLLAALAAGATGAAELTDDLVKRYDVDRATAQSDAEALLAALSAIL
jgi:hypothetical protein